MSPPDKVIKRAVEKAAKSTCLKSRRGCVVYDSCHWISGVGHNGPPVTGISCRLAFECDGSAKCKKLCSARCTHAEMRAMDQTYWEVGETFHLLHAKIDEIGRLISGGGPSCMECAKHILDTQLVDGVWLYEGDGSSEGQWRLYTRQAFYEHTLRNFMEKNK